MTPTLTPNLSSTQTPLMTWEAPSLPIYERGRLWYIIGGIVVLATAGYGILTGNWTLSIVSIMCGVMYFLIRNHTLPPVTLNIFENGINYDGTFYSWKDLTGFWFLETPTYIELRFSPVKWHKEDYIIQTGAQSVDSIRMVLGQYLTELTDKKETLLDIFSRLAKL